MLHCAAPALQQGHMLAQIAEEIHAPDRAAEDTGEGGNSDYQDLSLSMMLTHLIAIAIVVPFPARAQQVCVFLRCLLEYSSTIILSQ